MARRYCLYTQKKGKSEHLEADRQEFPKKFFNSISEANDYVKEQSIGKDRQAVLFNCHTGAVTYLPKED